ncbi:hypothetical protein PISMIDRAFT_686972 [Pisolithus microcarpus 441]|uniref:Uncharacterized protein n=1 Tax=Pisolithus microcarpus 441 TaxID=765257 RepID=A0A0C9Z0A2_9AGAM|nr:hypothetical protein PISMIDRAFT_686972 [Pisolithus microcarpus 441]
MSGITLHAVNVAVHSSKLEAQALSISRPCEELPWSIRAPPINKVYHPSYNPESNEEE